MFQGRIVSCDDQMAYIHGYPDPNTLHGSHIADLIPAIKLPVPGEKLTKVSPFNPLPDWETSKFAPVLKKSHHFTILI